MKALNLVFTCRQKPKLAGSPRPPPSGALKKGTSAGSVREPVRDSPRSVPYSSRSGFFAYRCQYVNK